MRVLRPLLCGRPQVCRRVCETRVARWLETLSVVRVFRVCVYTPEVAWAFLLCSQISMGLCTIGVVVDTVFAQSGAVVDALWHLGVRHIDIPVTPQKVWKILRDNGITE